MKAVLHEGVSGMEGLKYDENEQLEPKAGGERVRLKTSGRNRRDLFVPARHNSEDPALVLGSDGAGIVDAAGDGVENVKAGDEVIINPSLGWQKNSDAPPEGFEIV